MLTREQMLKKLRAERDFLAEHGEVTESLILNDRIKDLKRGKLGVERAMAVFESALARRRAYETPSIH